MKKIFFCVFLLLVLLPLPLIAQSNQAVGRFYLKYGMASGFEYKDTKANFDTIDFTSESVRYDNKHSLYDGNTLEIGYKYKSGLGGSIFYNHRRYLKGTSFVGGDKIEREITERIILSEINYNLYWNIFSVSPSIGLAYLEIKQYPYYSDYSGAELVDTQNYSYHSTLPVLGMEVGVCLFPTTKFSFLLNLEGITTSPFLYNSRYALNGVIFSVGLAY